MKSLFFFADILPILGDSSSSAKIIINKVDVSNTVQVEEWIKSAVAAFGQLDGCANVAGIALGEGEITEDIVSSASRR